MLRIGKLLLTRLHHGTIKEVWVKTSLGLMVGLIVGPAQQYLSHFIHHARAVLQHYEPPKGYNQWATFIR
jgi:hypothetical protein